MKKIMTAVLAALVLTGNVMAKDAIAECTDNNLSQCVTLGAHKWGDEKYQEAVVLFNKACNAGITIACLKKAYVYEDEAWDEHDSQKAEEIYTYIYPRAFEKCKNGKASECVVVGEMYFYGDSVKENIRTAATYYKKACELKDSMGCSIFAELYDEDAWHSGHLDHDSQKALLYYGKACQFGDADSCKTVEEINMLNSEDTKNTGAEK